jgi:hypothetical protein
MILYYNKFLITLAVEGLCKINFDFILTKFILIKIKV